MFLLSAFPEYLSSFFLLRNLLLTKSDGWNEQSFGLLTVIWQSMFHRDIVFQSTVLFPHYERINFHNLLHNLQAHLAPKNTSLTQYTVSWRKGVKPACQMISHQPFFTSVTLCLCKKPAWTWLVWRRWTRRAIHLLPTSTDLHARDVSIDVAQHALLQHRQVVEVPPRVDVLLDKRFTASSHCPSKQSQGYSVLARAVRDTVYWQNRACVHVS